MKRITTALMSLFVLATAATAQKKIELKFNPPVGKKFIYSIDMDMDMKMGGMPMPGQDSTGTINLKSHTIMDMDYLVNKKLGDTAFDITSTLQSMSLSMDMGAMGKKIEYSTQNPGDTTDMVVGIMHKIFRSLTGQKLNMVINNTGSVISLTGMDELMDKMMKNADMPEMQVAQMRAQYNDKNYLNQNQNYFRIYPLTAVKVGDGWTVEQDMGSSGIMQNMSIKSKYTLKEVKDGKAFVDVTTDMDAQYKNNTKKEATDENLTGTQTGTVVYDIKTGLATTTNMVMDMNLSNNGMPMQIHINMKVTTKM